MLTRQQRGIQKGNEAGNGIKNKIGFGCQNMLIYECITSYSYAYQHRCPKQDVLRTLVNAFYTI